MKYNLDTNTNLKRYTAVLLYIRFYAIISVSKPLVVRFHSSIRRFPLTAQISALPEMCRNFTMTLRKYRSRSSLNLLIESIYANSYSVAVMLPFFAFSEIFTFEICMALTLTFTMGQGQIYIYSSGKSMCDFLCWQ